MSLGRAGGKPGTTLRLRAFLPTLLAAVVLAAGAGLALERMTADLVHGRMTGRGAIAAHMVANIVESDRDSASMQRVVSALGAEPMLDLVVVAEGDPPRVIAASNREYVGHTLAVLEDSQIRGVIATAAREHREIHAPLSTTDALLSVTPTQHDDSRRGPLRGVVAVLVDGGTLRAATTAWQHGFVLLLLALFAGALLSAEIVLRSCVLRPVRAIAEAAARRRAGDREARAPVLADDELGRLATVLNEANAAVDEALRELEFQKFALDQAATVLVTDADGTIVYVNDAYCRLSGYSREELLGRNPRIVNSGHHPKEFFRDMHACVASGRIWRGEIRNRAKDGSHYWVHSTIIPSPGAEGSGGRLTAVLFDITERVQAERSLRMSEARMRQIIDSAIDAVVTMDQNGRIVHWNLQAERIFGWRADEVVGRPLVDTIVPPQFQAAHARGMARYLRTGEGSVLGQRVELVGLRRDGTEFPLELSISAVTLEQGVLFSAFVRDISDRLGAENELRQAKDAAQAASRAKSEFLATMSHEIRTPMNGVIGFTDLLLETPLDETQREYAETIRASGRSLLALISDILDFSKIEAGKLDVERVAFDAREGAAEVVDLLAAKAEERGLELVLDWPAGVPGRLLGDLLRYRQVLLNLVGNAIKFTAAGRIEIGAARDAAGLVQVRVADTGIGIPQERIPRLFRMFSQADSSTTRRFGGTGLGLAISRQLVDLMGGRIGVESEPGIGSTFWLALPAAAAAEVPAPNGARVLVVDTLDRTREVLAGNLAPHVAATAGAGGIDDAIALLGAAAAEGRPFDVALVSLRGAGADDTLRRALESAPAAPPPALVALVAPSRRGDLPRLRAAGFVEVVPRPVARFDVLAAALARAAGAPSGARAPGSVAPLPPSPAPAPEAGAGTGIRVLLAEDQPVNQKLAVRVLTRFGCLVDVARDGGEACALAAANDYAMVFMDCHMPEMDGFEATAAIRAREAAEAAAGRPGRSLPIVALTASALKADRDRCFASGMNDFISKPFQAEQVRAALERWTGDDGSSERPAREAA